MTKRNILLTAASLALVALAACSSDPATPSTGGSAVGQERCETGKWVSTSMDAPAQAGITDLTPAGGGDGMDITVGTDGVFQIDFGPMKPTTATFTSGGQEASLATTFSGVGKGTWNAKADGSGVVGTFDDLTTVKGTVTITLGQTVPPVFDDTLQQLNDNRMLGDQKTGVFDLAHCDGDTMTLSMPFPGGEVLIHAARKG